MNNEIVLHENMALVRLNGKEFKVKIQGDEIVITEVTGDIIIVHPSASNRIIIK